MYKRDWQILAILAVILTLIVAGCGPTPTTETMSPVGTPAASPSPASFEVPDGAEETIAAVKEDLAGRLGISPDEILVVSVEAVDWPDASLGCPEPGMSYAQVVTPGYLIALEAGGERYEYHTGDGNVVLCQEPEGDAGEATDLPPEAASLVRLAREDLSERLGVPEGQITVQLVEAVEWRDSSLGCPKPGFQYLQVITPGYRIRLVVDGEIHEYHTDDKNVVYCEQPTTQRTDEM